MSGASMLPVGPKTGCAPRRHLVRVRVRVRVRVGVRVRVSRSRGGGHRARLHAARHARVGLGPFGQKLLEAPG